MKLDSVRSLKAEISADWRWRQPDAGAPGVLAFYEATEPPTPKGVSVGVTRLPSGEFGLAVRHEVGFEAEAEALRERAAGEAVVRRVVDVRPRPESLPSYLQQIRRPLEPGAQIGLLRSDGVGTLGAFVHDHRGVLYALSNAHVLAESGTAQPGEAVTQPVQRPDFIVGVLDRFVPLSKIAPNLYDAALARLASVEALTGGFNAAAGAISGVSEVDPDQLGMDVVKVGRTTGTTVGKVTAVEMDGVRVNYGEHGILTFNDQLEISGGVGVDFSAAGDSGSLIALRDGTAIGLLFAGGHDGAGEDFTYANHLLGVLAALGVDLA